MKKSNLDIYLLLPIRKFIERRTSVGLVLILAAILACIIANSPLAHIYFNLWKQQVEIGFGNFVIRKSLLHWVNDGLMSIFFFVIGLELKREIMHGALSTVRMAFLPVAAAIGGMIFPALIFFAFNHHTPAIAGWGIPIATDIAFALGILHLVGDRVPLSLKIFLTAIAVADDIGAVFVIAIFYSTEISLQNLILGVVFLIILLSANYLGVRNNLFYAITGIGGMWLAILLSGLHPTIAAVVAAFTIPTSRRIDTPLFLRKINLLTDHIRKKLNAPPADPHKTQEEISETIAKFGSVVNDAIAPLQRIENSLLPFVNFVVLPIFAFANAGITFDSGFLKFYQAPVTLGIFLGLFLGKFIGIVLFTRLMLYFKICNLPKHVTWKHIYGVGLLGAIGFTMSLFITELAYEHEVYLAQAKVGIFSASVIAGILGYFYLKTFKLKNDSVQ